MGYQGIDRSLEVVSNQSDRKKTWLWWLSHGAALCSVLIWAANFPTIKFVDKQLEPVTLFWTRFVISAVLAMVVWGFKRPDFSKLLKKDWVLIIIMSILCGAVYQFLLVKGARYTSSVLIAMLISSQSLHVGWLAWIMLREKFRTWNIVAMVVAVIGCALPIMMNARGDISVANVPNAWIYPAMIAGAAAVSALFVVGPRIMGPRISSNDLFGIIFILAILWSGPFLLFEEPVKGWREMNWQGWSALIYLATVGHFVAVALWWWALKRLKATSVSVYLFTMMGFSGMWGMIILGETFHWSEFVAVGVMIIALSLNMLGKEKE